MSVNLNANNLIGGKLIEPEYFRVKFGGKHALPGSKDVLF